MALAKISPAQAATINLARQHAGDSDRKAIKKEVFATIKAAFGIPADTKLKVETTYTSSADYLVLKSKDGAVFNLSASGRWDGAAPVQTEAKRWFFVPQDELRNLLTDHVLGEDTDFGDGTTNPPTNATFSYDQAVALSDNAGIYVLIAESEF